MKLGMVSGPARLLLVAAAGFVVSCVEEHPKWIGAEGGSEAGDGEGEDGDAGDGDAGDGDGDAGDGDVGDGDGDAGDGDGDPGPCVDAGVGFSRASHLTIAGTSIQSDFVAFPAMVRLTPQRVDYAAAAADGGDLRFFDDDGQLLPHEIESWEEDGTSTLWVRLPDLIQGEPQSLWVCYGVDDAGAEPVASEVWETDYRGVWHLDGFGDSSANANDGVNAGTLEADGFAGAARDFDGTGARIEVPNDASLQVTGSLTVSALVRYASFDLEANSNTILVHSGPGNMNGDNVLYRFEYEPQELMPDNGVWLAWQWGADNNLYLVSPEDPAIGVDEWHLITAVRDAGNQEVHFYVDGASLGPPKSYGSQAMGGSNGALMLGANPSSPGAYNLHGMLDEVRVAATVRSSDYVALDFDSVSDGLFTYGPTVTVP